MLKRIVFPFWFEVSEAFERFEKLFSPFQSNQSSKKNYYRNDIAETEIAPVEVITGAFLLMKRELYLEIGGLDESYFMYGEDIDLSFSVLKSGKSNYYFSETTVIHYKGESTKKSSVNYVFIFYRAMVIFAKKHFSQNNAKLFSFAIHLAIYLRASLSIIRRFIEQITFPLLDLSVSLTGLYFLAERWKLKSILFPAGEAQRLVLHQVPTHRETRLRQCQGVFVIRRG